MTLPNPLLSVHELAGGEMQSYGELQVVQTFGVPQVEYAAIRKTAAVMDDAQRGVLELTGKDRLPFLNNLLTNQTYNKEAKEPMGARTGVYSFLLNTKGRVVTDMNVLELGDRTLLEMDARMVGEVEALLNKYLFADQVRIASLVGKVHVISVHGPAAAEAVGARGGEGAMGAIKSLGYLGSVDMEVGGIAGEGVEGQGSIARNPHPGPLPEYRERGNAPQAGPLNGGRGVRVVVYRDDVCGVPGYHLLVPGEGVVGVWEAFVREGGSVGPVRATGWAAFNTARIEAGRPLFGVDFDDTILPAETSQVNRAVSFTKGCYLGQEVVARMHARNQVAKRLVGFRMKEDALPLAGAPILDKESNTVGVVTSSTVSPVLSNAAIGLGYVKKPLFTVGTGVRIPAEGGMREAEVVEVPFVR